MRKNANHGIVKTDNGIQPFRSYSSETISTGKPQHQPLCLRTCDKKDPTYRDQVLSPYFASNKYPCASEKQKISLETQIPLQLVNDWYAEQLRKDWVKANPKREKYLRIRKAEPKLLKHFNEKVYFTGKTILSIMLETDLTFDEIKSWYANLVMKMRM